MAVRVMDTGEKSIVARGLLITASIFLFPHFYPFLDQKFHGVYLPSVFFPLHSPAKNTESNEKSPVTPLSPRKPPPFAPTSVYRINGYTFSITFSTDCPFLLLEISLPGGGSWWYSNFSIRGFLIKGAVYTGGGA